MNIQDDLKQAYDAIISKNKDYTTAFNYYDGDHPTVYTASRLKEVFSGVLERFTENWCSVVIDSVKDRIQLAGFDGPEGAQGAIDDIFEMNQLYLESDDLHEAMLVTGEAFAIVWRNEAGQAEIFYNDPRLCHAFYESENPRVMRYAAKIWVADDKTFRLTLYYPDQLFYFRTTQKAENVSSSSAFVVDDEIAPNGEAVNEAGQIPVFHFRISKRRVKSDLADVVPIQNGINKLLTDMMVAAEYGAFRQRWVISNSDTSVLKNAPNEIWSIPAGDGIGQSTSVGDFSPTDLGNYLEAIEKLAGDISRISRTPKHYFFAQGDTPSGEALMAMEAPLSRKVEDRIDRAKPVWAEAMAFALSLVGIAVDAREITPVFKIVRTVQPRTEAEIRAINVGAGMPLATTLRRDADWSESEIKQMMVEKEEEAPRVGEELLRAFEKGQG